MFNPSNINVLDSIYAVGNKSVSQTNYKKKIATKTNLLALIVSCVLKHFPATGNVSERKFMAFQEELHALLRETELPN